MTSPLMALLRRVRRKVWVAGVVEWGLDMFLWWSGAAIFIAALSPWLESLTMVRCGWVLAVLSGFVVAGVGIFRLRDKIGYPRWLLALGDHPRDLFLTVYELEKAGDSSDFIGRASAQAEIIFPQNWRHRLKAGFPWVRVVGVAILGPLAWVAWFTLSANDRGKFLWPWGSDPAFAINVEPGDAWVPRGSDVTVSVAASPLEGASPLLEVRTYGTGWERRGLVLSGAARFSTTLQSVMEPLVYRVVIGGAKSPRYRLTPFDPPRIRKVKAEVFPPAYTRKTPESFENISLIRAMAGSKIRWTVSLEGDPSSWRVEGVPGARGTGTCVWEQEAVHTGTHRLWVRQRGIETSPGEVRLEVSEDSPPTIEFLDPPGDVQADMGQPLPWKVEVKDDVGLRSLFVLRRRGEGGWSRRRIKTYGSMTTDDAVSGEWVAERMVSGDVEQYCFEAEDKRVPRQTGRSETRTVVWVDDSAPLQELSDALSRLRNNLNLRAMEQKSVWEGIRSSSPSWDQLGLDQKEMVRKFRQNKKEFDDTMIEVKDTLSDPITRLELSSLADRLNDLSGVDLPKAEAALDGMDASKAEPQVRRVKEKLQQSANALDAIGRGQEVRRQRREQSELTWRAERWSRSLETPMTAEEREEWEKTTASLQEAARRIHDQLKRLKTSDPIPADSFQKQETLRFDLVADAMGEAQRALEQGSVEEALRAAREALEQLRTIERQLSGSPGGSTGSAGPDQIAALAVTEGELKSLIRQEESLLDQTLKVGRSSSEGGGEGGASTGTARAPLRIHAEKQSLLSRSASDLAERVRELGEANLLLPSTVDRHIDAASGHMREASGLLLEGNPPLAIKAQRSALDALRLAEEELEKTKETMESMASLGSSCGTLYRLPGKVVPAGSGIVGPVQLPETTDVRDPADIRREMRRSLQESYPKNEERAIRDYYRRWTK